MTRNKWLAKHAVGFAMAIVPSFFASAAIDDCPRKASIPGMATVQGCGFQQVIVVGKVDRPIDSNRYDSVDFPRPGFGGISGESGGSGGSGAPATQTGKAAATSVSNSSRTYAK